MDWKLNSNNIGSIQIFCKAAELESFTAAANFLGVTPAAVSRSIARIEERLGARLFARSTRKIKLTDDGRLYFAECLQALRQIEEVENLISGNLGEPKGKLRISVPTTYGHCRVMPVLVRYRKLYPQVDLEINISNKNIDFVEEGYDLAIRLGQPKDSRLIARKLESAYLGVYASAEYLRQNGVPKSHQELEHHQIIQFIMPSTGKCLPWVFNDDGQEIFYEFANPLAFSGDVLGCMSYAAAGGGFFQTYDFVARQKQYAHMVEVLKPYRGAHRIFSVVYQQNKMVSAKVRAFIDLLVEECGA